MASPPVDEARRRPVLPTTAYPPTAIPLTSSRPMRRQHRITAPQRRMLLVVTGLVLVALVFHQTLPREWRLTTRPWGFPPPTTDTLLEELQPAPVHSIAHETASKCAMDRLRQMVDQTKGFLARDYSLWLGWNNMRYIIEAGVLQAALLNRTLILPSFVYARQCEVALEVCGAFLDMVNRGDAIGWDEWRLLPIEKQMGWKVPIGMMIDLNQLRQAHAVVTMEEYLKLHSLPIDLEQGNGQWSDSVYLTKSRPIPDSRWDPPEVIRVDQERPPFVLDESDPVSIRAFQAREDVKAKMEQMIEAQQPNLLHQKLLDWAPIQQTLRSMDLDVSDDHSIELFLRAAGFEVLHTYQGWKGYNFIKSVTTPIKQVARMSEVHGSIDEFGSWADTVVHLQGEVHDNRQPGFLRFTSVANLQYFSRTVLYDLGSPLDLAALALRVDERMRERTGGRLWRAAHVRRGDFMKMGWAEWSLPRHIDLVKTRLGVAPEIWQEIRTSHTAHTFDIPGAQLNPAMFEGEIPRVDDPFYIATDERSPEALDFMRSRGGVLIMDLLKPEDRQIVGWPLLVSDLLALAEQHVMARAAYFSGNAMSSVTGGVLNLRAINGWDPRTATLE